MTSITITDGGGESFQAKMIGGRQYPDGSMDSLNNVFNFKARPDDILLCAYPRSGTHWIYEVMRFLLAGTTELPFYDKENGFIEMASPSSLEELPSPRSLNTHFHFDGLSPEFLQQKCKIIYVTRNPRDQAVSSYKQKTMRCSDYNGQWKDYLELIMEGKVSYGSWFDYIKGWEQGIKENPDHPFLVMSYEAMKQDPLKEARRLSEFLGLKHTDDFLIEVVKKTGFDVMSARFAEVFRITTDETEKKQAEHACMKGAVGTWKNWFTVAQSELFEEKFEREMPGTEAYNLYSLNSE